jgi:acetyl esterase
MLHPQARALLRLMEEKGVPPTHTLTPADARTFYRQRRTFTQPDPPEVGAVRDLHATGPHGAIAVRSYRPRDARENAPLPVLVYYHGGGWVIGDLDTHDVLCRQLCNLSGCAVVAVDYRMGPEHRFPAAVDDALAAAHWVRAQADALRVDPRRLAVGGDSAGGNLAAVVALAARDAGDLPVAFQLLIYPATDQRRGAPSHAANGQGYLLTKETMTTSMTTTSRTRCRTWTGARRPCCTPATPACRPPSCSPPATTRCATRGCSTRTSSRKRATAPRW